MSDRDGSDDSIDWEQMPVRHFADDRHAIYVGWVLGSLIRTSSQVRPVLDDRGNYTDRIEVRLPGVGYVGLIVPEPPDDWVLT